MEDIACIFSSHMDNVLSWLILDRMLLPKTAKEVLSMEDYGRGNQLILF